jgi:hypothetical protein
VRRAFVVFSCDQRRTFCRSVEGAGALIGGGLADTFDKRRVDSTVGVVTRNPRQPAVNHEPHAVNQIGFRDVRGDDDFG